jgi:hypothetical protein
MQRIRKRTSRRQPRLRMQTSLPQTIQNRESTFTTTQSLEINGAGALASSTSVPTFYSIALSLNAFDQYTSLVALFDWYRFLEAEYTFLPRVRSTVSNDQAFSVTPNVGIFHSVVDQNSVAVLTTIGQALDYPSCKTWSAGAPNNLLVQRFCPKVALGTNAGTLVNQKDIWYATSANSAAWAGILTAWTITSQIYQMDVIIRVKMQFKNCR